MALPLRVLLLEDNPDDVDLLQIELSRGRSEVYIERVETAADMLAALKGGAWDIIISDYNMPRFSAGEALELLHSTGLDLPFIVVSGTVGEETAVAAMRTGVNDYLSKTNLARLLPAIEREVREAENRRARREAEQEAHLLAAIVASSSEAIISKSPEGIITSWNPAAERLFGWRPEEAIGKPIALIVPQDRLEEVDRTMRLLLQQGHGDQTFETVRLHREGSLIDVAVTISLVRDSQQQFVGFSKFVRDIRDRRRSELALRASEARFRAVVEKSFDGVLLLDRDGTIVYASPSAAEIGGRTVEECTGKNIHQLVHPDEIAGFTAWLRGMAAGVATSTPLANRFLHADGTWRWIETTSTDLFGDPDVNYMVVNFRDITERMVSDQELRQARWDAERGLAQLRAVISSMTEGVIIADAEGNLLDWNEAALRMLGHQGVAEVRKPLEEFTAIYELLSPSRLPLPLSEWPMARILRGETLVSWELYVRRKDTGLEKLISFGGSPVFGPGQGLELAVLTLHDLTDHRSVQTERDRLLAHLRLQIERMPLGYILLDDREQIIDWNPAAEHIFGFARSEVLGWVFPFEKLVPGQPLVGIEERRRRSEAGVQTTHDVYENRTRDGKTIICEWFNTSLTDPHGRFSGLLCLVQDITEKRSLEEQLRQSQKMEAIGQLAGGIAHDFNNLLTIICGYSTVLLLGKDPEDPSRPLLEEIHRAGERSAALTRQLLVFSRKQVVAPSLLSLNKVVIDTETLLRRIIGEDVRLVTSLKARPDLILADFGQLEQVLMNLAVNARDAMPLGGSLTIETEDVQLAEDYVHLHPGARPGPHVLLVVSDTGCGMTEQVQARIFEPFFTTKEAGKGTGLGLAVVHGIVRQGGGHLEVVSEPGVGTSIKVYFPHVDQKEGAAHTRPHTRQAPTPLPWGCETVLVVEDEDGVRTLMRHVLEGSGYTVLDAADAEQALSLIENDSGSIALVVTDVVMPGMDGRHLVERIKTRLPEIKVLFVSGYTDDAVVRHGVLAEEVHFLHKPYSPGDLAFKVREVLDSKETGSRTPLP